METRRNKPWFDQKFSELASKRKQAKLLWLQNPNDQTHIRHNTCRTFRKKKCDKMKAKVNKLKKK